MDGWRVLSETPDRITVRELLPKSPSSFSAQVGVRLVSAPGAQQTLIQLDAFSVGLGRIQCGHLYGRLAELKYTIAACAGGAPAPAPERIADEINALAEQRDRGTISEAEFTAAKARVLGF